MTSLCYTYQSRLVQGRCRQPSARAFHFRFQRRTYWRSHPLHLASCLLASDRQEGCRAPDSRAPSRHCPSARQPGRHGCWCTHAEIESRGITHYLGLIVGLCPANERRCYFATTSLIGWAQARLESAQLLSPWPPVDSPHKVPERRRALPCNDVLMGHCWSHFTVRFSEPDYHQPNWQDVTPVAHFTNMD